MILWYLNLFQVESENESVKSQLHSFSCLIFFAILMKYFKCQFTIIGDNGEPIVKPYSYWYMPESVV